MFGQKPLFGSNSLFGQTQQTGTANIFGAPATTPQQNVSAFGQGNQFFGANRPQSNLFATPSSSFGFGNQLSNNANLTSNATSNPTNVFGFGASNPQSSNLFANPASTIVGTQVKFKVPTTQDTMNKNGAMHNITAAIECISAMKEYENKSLEELRAEDYSSNRKFPQIAPTAQTPSLFNAFQPQQPASNIPGTSGLFGQTFFGATTTVSTGMFGQPAAVATTPSLFGMQPQASNLSIFGQPQATTSVSLFGQPAQVTSANTGSLFGTGIGGASGMFGNANKFALGSASNIVAPSTGSAFSFNFGQPSTTTAPSLFGQTPQTASGLTGFSLFSSPAVAKPSFPVFGAITTSAPAPSFFGAAGSSAFPPFPGLAQQSSAPSNSLFSFTSPLNAASSAPTAFPQSLFGAQPQATSLPTGSVGGFSFGANPLFKPLQTQPGPLAAVQPFNMGAPSAIGGGFSSMFPSAASAAVSSAPSIGFGGFNLFNQPQSQPQATNSLLFGSSLFPAPAATTGISAFGTGTGLFGGTAANSSLFPTGQQNMFGTGGTSFQPSQQPSLFQQGQQQLQMNQQPQLFPQNAPLGSTNVLDPNNIALSALRKQILDMVTLMPYGDVPMVGQSHIKDIKKTMPDQSQVDSSLKNASSISAPYHPSPLAQLSARYSSNRSRDLSPFSLYNNGSFIFPSNWSGGTKQSESAKLKQLFARLPEDSPDADAHSLADEFVPRRRHDSLRNNISLLSPRNIGSPSLLRSPKLDSTKRNVSNIKKLNLTPKLSTRSPDSNVNTTNFDSNASILNSNISAQNDIFAPDNLSSSLLLSSDVYNGRPVERFTADNKLRDRIDGPSEREVSNIPVVNFQNEITEDDNRIIYENRFISPPKIVVDRPLFKCNKPGYYTEPDEEECYRRLRAQIKGSPENNSKKKCLLVSDFVIGRKGYGSITFPGPINVIGLNIDKDVYIEIKNVEIYPEESEKPVLGEGMNTRAIVSLHNTWPKDKTTLSPVRDIDRIEEINYEKRLRIACKKMGVIFLDYIPTTGTWIFEVSHF
ncbi:unnamed protein product [Gordionus sp. m RMFG-2023]|uniref:nuclear pore complex protein Nup98-Nup96-like n=1 Tax=Gordionus sp. m RMFG-2023 TaxID=3053472 RepID=UPI0030DEFB19